MQSADFARQADEVMYEERDRLRTSLLSGVTVLQIQHALGIYSNWLQACAALGHCMLGSRVLEMCNAQSLSFEPRNRCSSPRPPSGQPN